MLLGYNDTAICESSFNTSSSPPSQADGADANHF